MTTLPYSVVIATFERPTELAATLDQLAAQTRPPEQVIVVDASHGEETRHVVARHRSALAVRNERAAAPSSAVQRNQGAEHVVTPLIAFIDDDVRLPATTLADLAAVLENDDEGAVGGVAARIVGQQHSQPRGLLWWYYRLQAGYAHPTYGGHLFGPAINCLPSYTEAAGDLIPAQWLNSTCVLYRTELFRREQFPRFDGYSFLEDVHLSARIARTHRLYFHKHALYEHLDAPSPHKRNPRAIARMRYRNQRIVARDVMGFSGVAFTLKLLLHRAFGTVRILRVRGPGWGEELFGTWF